MPDELVLRGVTTGHIANIPVVHSVDLCVPAGEVVGLMGRNGAGKSTLAAAIAGVIRTWSGTITAGGWDCTSATSRQRVGHGVVPVPENRRLFGQLTVIENLRAAAYGAHCKLTQKVLKEIEAEFPIIGRKADERCSVLSGGEQQMVALARARLMKPSFVVLDEPSLGLSPAVTSQLAETIRGFAASGVGVLLIEQNITLIEKVCKSIKLLDQGRIQRDMSVDDLETRESVIAAYLGILTSYDTGTGDLELPQPLAGPQHKGSA